MYFHVLVAVLELTRKRSTDRNPTRNVGVDGEAVNKKMFANFD